MTARVALLIGTAQYRDPTLSRLRTPAQDARRLADLLRDPAIGRFDSVQVLIDPRKQEIEEETENLFADRSPGDLALLYLACHGVKNQRGRLFFAASTTALSRLNSTAVAAAYVNEIMEQSRAGMKIAMLDCCFSGAYARGLAPRSGVQLAQQLAGRGTFVMTATDALEYAYEDGGAVPAGGERSSVFTRSVIAGMETGDADLDGDGLITADDLFGYVERRVSETREQTPKRFAANASGTIPLAWVRPPGLASVTPLGGITGRGDSCVLGDLLPDIAADPQRGLSAGGWLGNGDLVVPLGVARKSGRRELATFSVDLSHWAGNLGVAGASQAGKTTLLRTLICSLALTHTPDEVQVYCLDFDGDLRSMVGLPHVGGVAGRLDPGLAGEVARMAAGIAEQRRDRFARAGIESMREFRSRKRNGQVTDDPFGDVFLIVDGWPALVSHFAEIEPPLLQVAESGLRFGVHLAVSASRWSDLPDPLRRRLTTRIELPIGDIRESEFETSLGGEIPPGQPGHALVHGPAFLTVGLPRIDGVRSADNLADGIASLVSQVDLAWHGAPARPALASFPLPAASPDAGARSGGLPELLGIPGIRNLSLERLWRQRPSRDQLRVPIGTAIDGTPLELDLKAPQHGGMGPHGLLVGASGSGKSELLRTIVLALALTHPPGAVNFLLAGWKGRATFGSLGALPHGAGVAGGLAESPGLVDRLAHVIMGELARRQELIKKESAVSAHDYQLARRHGKDLPELPDLIIVIDDFAELLAAHPEFLETLGSVAAVGRSLGVHLLLSGQRLDQGRLHGLDTHLTFRIALRTGSQAESREVIGLPDAYELPPAPGSGYLRVGAGNLVRFHGARVSDYADAAAGEYAPRVIDIAVDAMGDRASSPRQLWLPPLTAAPAIDELPSPDEPPPGLLFATAGIADLPGEHRQPALVLNLSGPESADRGLVAGDFKVIDGDGNVIVIGTRGSGKSSLAATIVSSLALACSPADVQFFLLAPERADGPLSALAALPHVSAVASKGHVTEQELTRRAVTECTRLIDRREEQFAAAEINSASGLRAKGWLTDGPYRDVFLVIDGWRALADRPDNLVSEIALIVQRGPRYGVHVILTAEERLDIPPSVTVNASMLELRLADPADSQADKKEAARLPAEPGHGLTSDAIRFLAARPGDAMAQAARCAERWPGISAPRLRTLPLTVPYAELPPMGNGSLRIPVGLGEELRPVFVDLGESPFFLIYGDSGSGKTSLLRTLIASIAVACDHTQVMIMTADYRHGLLDATDIPHKLAHCYSAASFSSKLDELVEALRKRLPPPDLTIEQLHKRSWWEGPKVVLIVDDYDMVVTGSGTNPMSKLLDLLPHARDIGLHVVIARRTVGVSRTMFDPVIQRIRELDAAGILLSGNPDEGSLLGVRLSAQPPGRGFLVRHGAEPILVQLSEFQENGTG